MKLMEKNIMTKIYLIILLLVFIIQSSRNQSAPAVPCPEIFSYVINSQTYQIEGRITISDTQPGIENIILLKMTYPPNVINNYAGTIALTKNNAETVRDISENLPVVYRVDFPTTIPVPTLKEIISNNRIICSNSATQGRFSEIKLTHKLRVPDTIQLAQHNNSPSSSANASPRPIQQLPPQIPPLPQGVSQQNITSQIPRIDNNISVACGTTVAPINLIFGGKKMRPGTWPWLVAMFIKNKRGQFEFSCSGNLVTPNAVITAAHCVAENNGIRNTHDILIGLGIFNIFNWNEPNTYIANIIRIISHPEYARKSLYDADVAILILDKSYSYNHLIRPVCIWSGSNDLNSIINRDGQVAGWGLAKINGGSEPEPSIIQAQIVSDEKCLRSNDAFSSITTERNLCAGYRDGNGPCIGDSGSGLILDINGKWYLRGLVSGSIAHPTTTCDLKQYIIYTDIAHFLDWIRSNII